MSESLFYDEVISCRACPRLVAYRESVKEKGGSYWKRPVPGLGNPDSGLMIVGLAPSAQGGNRTGRIFTGDKSGDFLFKVLYSVGISNSPVSRGPGDGLRVDGAYITAVVKCAPPKNAPTREEAETCASRFLIREIERVRPRAIVVLGGFAYRWTIWALRRLGHTVKAEKFRHGLVVETDRGVKIFCSYHPSPQNTNTGKLNERMMADVMKMALREAGHNKA